MLHSRRTTFAILGVLPAAVAADADVLTFRQNSAPTADYAHTATFIRSDQATTNFGSDNALLTGNTVAGTDLRSLFSFDLSALPTGAPIDSVTLSLFQNSDATSDAAAVRLDLQPLTVGITEAGATWNNRAAGTPWGSPGGDFGPDLLSSLTISPTATSTSRTFASTGNFVAAAQAAYDNASPLAFILKLTDETGTARRIFNFTSDDFSTPLVQRPLLTINYTIPEPSIIGLTLVGLAVVTGRRRRVA